MNRKRKDQSKGRARTLDWHVSLHNLLPRDSSSNHQSSDSAGNRRRPRPVGGLEQGPGTEPGDDAVDPVVLIPRGDHPALEPGVQEADDAEAVADPAAVLAAGVEDAVDADLRGVPGLRRSEGMADAEGGAGSRPGEVSDASVVGEVLAPGATLGDGFFLEEKLRGRGEVVEGAVGDLKIVVGVVKPPSARILSAIGVISPIGPRIGHLSPSYF
ncbi:unnamed protein product [Musa banksii]